LAHGDLFPKYHYFFLAGQFDVLYTYLIPYHTQINYRNHNKYQYGNIYYFIWANQFNSWLATILIVTVYFCVNHYYYCNTIINKRIFKNVFYKWDSLHKCRNRRTNKLNQNKYWMESNTTILLHISLLIIYQYHIIIPIQVASFQIRHKQIDCLIGMYHMWQHYLCNVTFK